MKPSSISDFKSQIEKTIMEANNTFEKGWEGFNELSSLFGLKRESNIAIHRLMSYNPLNPMIQNSSLYPAAVLLTNLITNKEKSLNQDEEKIPTTDWIILAHSYLMLNDYVNAYSLYTRVLSRKEEITDGSFWYGIGIVYQHFKYYNKAIEFFLKCQSFSPILDQSTMKFRLALCYRSNDQAQESIPIFQSLLDSPPNGLTSDDIKFHLAFSYQLTNQKDQAISLYKELLANHPNSEEVTQQLAWYLSLQSDSLPLEQFINSLSNELKANPIIQLLRAKLAMRKLDMTTAYELFSQCIAYWNNNPLFWCNLGILYFKNEQYQDSVIAFQRALYLNADIPEAWLNFGLVFEIRKEIDNAKRIYSIGIQNCTDSTILKEKLDQINHLNPSMNKSSSYHTMDINDTKLFVQIPDKYALLQIIQVPRFSTRNLEIDEENQKTLDLLITPMISIFS